ncbi:MAG: S9 family peptidase [Deltaproteobacteria bacterium]|nr:S9 family peptidase [Deltaproteobacteria bacterium]
MSAHRLPRWLVTTSLIAALALPWACASSPPAAPPEAPPTAAPAPAAPKAPEGHPAEGLIPRQVLFGNPERVHVQVSPDGKRLAWLAPKDGVLNVWVAPVGDLAAARAVTADTQRPVRAYFWAWDDRHLLYVQDKGGDENFHLWSVDLAKEGAAAVDLTPLENTRVQLYGVSPRKPHTVLVGLNDRNPQYHDAYSVDLDSGERTLVRQNDEYAELIADDDLTLRLGVAMQPDGSQKITELAPKKGKEPVVIEVPAGDTATTTPVGFDKAGKTLYLIDSRGRDTGALFTVDLASGKAKLVAEDARADAADVMIHPVDNRLEAVRFDYEKPEWKVLDKAVAKDFAALAAVAPGDLSVVSRTRKDDVWIVSFESDVQPAAYYRWDRKKQAATFLFAARPALADLPLAAMLPVVIEARDGMKLVSYLTLPAGSDPDGDGVPAAPVPMVLFVHGGPWARDSWGYNPVTQMLANRGYAVLQVNYRGSTGFGKAFTNAANLQWGKAMHDDLLDAVAWAVGRKIAPADKVGILGGSYGGYATLVGLAMTPKTFACGVDIVGPSNLLTLIATIPPYWAPMITEFKTRMGDWTTEEGKAALTAVSPLTHVGAIERPLLIGQGANDPRVKQAESDQIVTAMQERGIPVSYVLFPDEGHGFARPENRLAFFAVTEAFLSAYLGGVYEPIRASDLGGSSMEVRAGREGIPGLPLPTSP